MTLFQILVFTLLALTYWAIFSPRGASSGLFDRIPAAPARARLQPGYVLLIASILALYWMQPSMPIRSMDFWLPTAALGLAAFSWGSARLDTSEKLTCQDGVDALVVAGTVLAVALTRYLSPICCLTPTPPPPVWMVAAGIAIIGLATFAAARSPRLGWSWAAIILLLAILIVLKTPALAQQASAALRMTQGQTPSLATPVDIRWLGFSYLAFRLIHTLRDRQAGKPAAARLSEYLLYGLFFPAYPSGPIDRLPRFMGDAKHPAYALKQPDALEPTSPSLRWQPAYEDLAQGFTRLFLGVFYKFALADSLALIALAPQNADQARSTLWLWVLLYAYTLRIFFDFAGYTHIALGLGRLMGFRLPENFDKPYLRVNLTSFWNSWHITLAQWFRAYYFNPLTRYLRSRLRKLPTWSIIFVGQFTTMLLIGLWHGVTWNFALWGAWHGMGLFIHNRYLEWARLHLEPQHSGMQNRPLIASSVKFGSWALTFNFVALGWVWFALATPAQSWNVLLRLFGIE